MKIYDFKIDTRMLILYNLPTVVTDKNLVIG